MNIMFAAWLGGWEIVLILAVVLILFGAKKLPELAKGLGHGIREFKKATREVTDEIQNSTDDTLPPAPQQKLPADAGQQRTEKAVPDSPGSSPKA